MSASLHPENASIDVLSAQLAAEAERNGAMKFALELAYWAHEHRHELAPHLRAELANLVLKAGL